MCFGKKKSAFSVSSIELQKNEEIDKMIRKDKKKMKKEIKILLLGQSVPLITSISLPNRES